MSSTSLQHSKFKNPGILFELLVRQVTADTLEGQTESPALSIIKEFFKSSTELGKELALYRAFFNANKLTENRAMKLIDMIIEQRKKIDVKKLNEQKYELVKKIKDEYPLKEFLSSKIPQYRIYASIYKTFLSETYAASIDIGDITEVAAARFTLVEHLMGDGDKKETRQNTLIETFKRQEEDLRLLSYKILVDRFNDKYSKGLSEDQKKLLREYINNVSNSNSLRDHINAEVPKVKKAILEKLKNVKNKVTQIKLHEVASQLDSITKGKTVRDNQVSALMIAYSIISELDGVK